MQECFRCDQQKPVDVCLDCYNALKHVTEVNLHNAQREIDRLTHLCVTFRKALEVCDIDINKRNEALKAWTSYLEEVNTKGVKQ